MTFQASSNSVGSTALAAVSDRTLAPIRKITVHAYAQDASEALPES